MRVKALTAQGSAPRVNLRGASGSHRVRVGDETKILQLAIPVKPRCQSLSGRPRLNASPWSEQSGNRKVLPERVSTGQRAQVVCIESSRKRRGVDGHANKTRGDHHSTNLDKKGKASARAKRWRGAGASHTPAGVEPCRRFLLLSLTPYAPVLKAQQRELQAVQPKLGQGGLEAWLPYPLGGVPKGMGEVREG